MFNKTFINTLNRIATANTTDGNRVKRADLYDLAGGQDATGLSCNDFESVLSVLVAAGYFPGFTLVRGVKGGLGRVADEQARHAAKLEKRQRAAERHQANAAKALAAAAALAAEADAEPADEPEAEAG